MVSGKYLREWAYLSMDKRVDEIKKQFNVNISRITLATIYRRNGINYKTIGFNWSIRDASTLIEK